MTTNGLIQLLKSSVSIGAKKKGTILDHFGLNQTIASARKLIKSSQLFKDQHWFQKEKICYIFSILESLICRKLLFMKYLQSNSLTIEGSLKLPK